MLEALHVAAAQLPPDPPGVPGLVHFGVEPVASPGALTWSAHLDKVFQGDQGTLLPSEESYDRAATVQALPVSTHPTIATEPPR